jgi:hypothetical protein
MNKHEDQEEDEVAFKENSKKETADHFIDSVTMLYIL